MRSTKEKSKPSKKKTKRTRTATELVISDDDDDNRKIDESNNTQQQQSSIAFHSPPRQQNNVGTQQTNTMAGSFNCFERRKFRMVESNSSPSNNTTISKEEEDKISLLSPLFGNNNGSDGNQCSPAAASAAVVGKQRNRVALLQSLVFFSFAVLQQPFGGNSCGAEAAAAVSVAAAPEGDSDILSSSGGVARQHPDDDWCVFEGEDEEEEKPVQKKKQQKHEQDELKKKERKTLSSSSSVELENYFDYNEFFSEAASATLHPTTQAPSKSPSDRENKEFFNNDEDDEDNSSNHLHIAQVIVVATVDGTMAGLDKATGRILWKRTSSSSNNDSSSSSSSTSAEEEQVIFQPLLSTTTTAKSSASPSDHWRTIAVPSIDGQVHLTAAAPRDHRQRQQREASTSLQETNSDSTTGDHHEQQNQQHAGSSSAGSGSGGGSGGSRSSAAAPEDITVTTTVPDVVARSPFVDSRGRIYTGTRQSTAFAIDGTTGDVVKVVLPATACSHAATTTHNSHQQKNNGGGGSGARSNNNNCHDESGPGGNSNGNTNSLVWLGRVDYSVSVHEPRSGQLDVQFSSSTIMGVQDMLLGASPTSSSSRKQNNPWEPNPRNGNRGGSSNKGMDGSSSFDNQLVVPNSQAELISPFATMDEESRPGDTHSSRSSSSSSSKTSSSTSSSGLLTTTLFPLVATPSGHVAYRDPVTGSILWVVSESFATPVAFAIDGVTGTSVGVDMVPDAILPGVRSTEYLAQQLQRQILLVDGGGVEDFEEDDLLSSSPTTTESEKVHDNEEVDSDDDDDDTPDEQTIVGALSSGQLFAMPLARRQNYHSKKESSSWIRQSAASSTAPSKSFYGKQNSHISSVGRHHSFFYQDQQQQQAASSSSSSSSPIIGRRTCSSGDKHFPACLVPHSGHSVSDTVALAEYKSFFGNDGRRNDHHHQPLGSEETALASLDGATSAVVPFQQNRNSEDFPSEQYDHKDFQHQRKRYQKVLRILGSWLPPTIALIFVLSFEMGRRKRQKDAASGDQDELESSNEIVEVDGVMTSTTIVGVIQVYDNVILGYGGHGTVVYKGILDGRQVAVKRMLKTYLASADREISLLIESDGHPNVVRYFLKEVRGDFVYLALELCDLSLHDLISTLRTRRDQLEKEHQLAISDSSSSVPVAPASTEASTRALLFQIANGVKHLHSLRIVHRDLKPMNILLADSKKKLKRQEHESVCTVFDDDGYVAKISDMGLSKQLTGQSSFGASLIGDSSSFRGVSNGAQSSIVGAGPGSVGWQAPEVMAMRIPSDNSVRSEGSHAGSESIIDASPLDHAANSRTSRSVDIFSLGCIFYTTLVPAEHPFGAWFEREANIMHNRPNLELLEGVSLDAYDLVNSMIQRSPPARPTAKQVCEHPYFWSRDRKLSFLCDFSDRLEMEGIGVGLQDTYSLTQSIAIERNASKVVGLAWDTSLDDELISNVQKFRTYDPSSIRHLLRLIRNKHHHFDELSTGLKAIIGSKTEGLMGYIEARFPRLLIHCFDVCRDILPIDDALAVKYAIVPKGKIAKRMETKVSTISEGAAVGIEDEEEFAPTEERNQGISETNEVATGSDEEANADTTVSSSNTVGSRVLHLKYEEAIATTTQSKVVPSPEQVETSSPGESKIKNSVQESEAKISSVSQEQIEEKTQPEEEGVVEPTRDSQESTKEPNLQCFTTTTTGARSLDVGDVVIWQGSTAAKALNCRGWFRSDDDWSRRMDAKLRKRDSNLVRCSEDPKFRTRLCNFWDTTHGTTCPLLRKKKCIFAHGPVELRVKEGKRERWGKLVDDNGDNNNAKHSGGEDTYGAARSIENERKQEGKWGADGNNKQQQQQSKAKKSGGQKNAATPKKKSGSKENATPANSSSNSKKKTKQPTTPTKESAAGSIVNNHSDASAGGTGEEVQRPSKDTPTGSSSDALKKSSCSPVKDNATAECLVAKEITASGTI